MQKKELRVELGISGKDQASSTTWCERLHVWKEVLRKEKLSEQLNSMNAKYAVEFDFKRLKIVSRLWCKKHQTQGTRALCISKIWWRYCLKLPYPYCLQKLACSEYSFFLLVAAVIFTEDLKRLYVTMKEGFLLDYCFGVEADLLQKRQIHYFLKPVGDGSETKSMNKVVVMGGCCLLGELMIYMGYPMQYYEKFSLFGCSSLRTSRNRKDTICTNTNQGKWDPLCVCLWCGLHREKSGAARINGMLFTAQRNAPCFIYVNGIDAIAGRHARDNPRRRATFKALITQLDEESSIEFNHLFLGMRHFPPLFKWPFIVLDNYVAKNV